MVQLVPNSTQPPVHRSNNNTNKKKKKKESMIQMQPHPILEKEEKEERRGERIHFSGILSRDFVMEEKESALCVEISRDGEFVAVGFSHSVIKVYSLREQCVVYALRFSWEQDSSASVTALRWKPQWAVEGVKYALLASYSTGRLIEWHVATKGIISDFYEPRNEIYCVDYATDGLRFASGGMDSMLRVYDSQKGLRRLYKTFKAGSASSSFLQQQQQQSCSGHVSRIYCVRFHPSDPQVLASAGWDNSVKFWHLERDAPIRCLVGPHVCGDGLEFFVSRESSELMMVTASWRRNQPLQVWNLDELGLEAETREQSQRRPEENSHKSKVVVSSTPVGTVEEMWMKGGEVPGSKPSVATMPYGVKVISTNATVERFVPEGAYDSAGSRIPGETKKSLFDLYDLENVLNSEYPSDGEGSEGDSSGEEEKKEVEKNDIVDTVMLDADTHESEQGIKGDELSGTYVTEKGSLFALCGSNKNAMYILDNTGKIHGAIEGFNEGVYSLDYSPEANIVVCVGGDGAICVGKIN
eukprot:Nk52_evm58s212 gene=Nk52_evmTU58s212